MIRIGIVGDIGSGKTFVANNFGYPVFNADHEVSKLYKKDRKTYLKQKLLTEPLLRRLGLKFFYLLLYNLIC